MKTIPNLSAQATFDAVPWQFVWKDSPEVQAARRNNKDARSAWIRKPDTLHQCWSPWEGVNGAVRVSRGKGADEGNPAFLLHALVADFDAPCSLDDVQAGVERRCADWFVPTAIELTMTPGHSRWVWPLSEPVTFASHSFAVHCLKFFASKVNFNRILAGFDEGGYLDPSRYYTNSGDWRLVEGAQPIDANIIRGWVQEASAKFDWTPLGLVVPLDLVAAALARSYPGFRDWPGDFALGAQGPSFWVSGSTSPLSAIVRESGLQTFAAHASKAFYSWSELLGATFVEEFRAKQIGTATDGIHWDGELYWHRGVAGNWHSYRTEDLIRYLRVMRGLSIAKDKAGISQIDRALVFLQQHQRVDEASPRVFQPGGLLIEAGGSRVLNVSHLRVAAPQAEPAAWGAGGGFPWISQFLDTLFAEPEQKEAFIAWLARYYKGAFEQKPVGGHALFLVGGVSIGKSLLNREIVGTLMGGCVEAGAYLAGRDNFGGELFAVGHWVVDDFSTISDARTKQAFSEGLKAVVANQKFRWHVKNRMPRLIPWTGRVLITCNSDALSNDIMPELSVSINEKIMLLRCVETPAVVFPEREALQAVIRAELPAFARFLLEYRAPDYLCGESRFGIKAFLDADLREKAEETGRVELFREALQSALDSYFRASPDEVCWDGTTTALHQLIDATGGARGLNLNAMWTGRLTHALMARDSCDFTIARVRRHRGHAWRIGRPTPEAA